MHQPSPPSTASNVNSRSPAFAEASAGESVTRHSVGDGGSFPRRVFCARVLLCRFTHPFEAGLSHVTEEIEEESIVPSCALELGSQGDFCVGMSAGDIGGEGLRDGEVGWGIVLSIGRQVFSEQGIERRMQSFF